VFGLSVVALMLWLPDGLLSIPDRLQARRRAKAARAAALAVPAEGQA
jgi:branched-chain amino acid transport system permease protein